MASSSGDTSVSLAPGGFLPQSFRWQSHSYRVLAVESVKTRGLERRYKVASREGHFELALDTARDTWRVRRRPIWLSRVWYRFQNGARYPLPAWRRRQARKLPVRYAGVQLGPEVVEPVRSKARVA